MRIIFLDIDGVLNTHYSCERYGIDYIDSGLVEVLRGIIIATNASYRPFSKLKFRYFLSTVTGSCFLFY